MSSIRLGVNIDHVATLRKARGGARPDPSEAVALCQRGGADGITFHLREDRRHIEDADLPRIRRCSLLPLNMEMAASPEIVAIAMDFRPHQVTLVPERRAEITTEGGLDAAGQIAPLTPVVAGFRGSGVRVSLFIDPEPDQVRAAARLGAHCVEFHTGCYANALPAARAAKLARLSEAAVLAHGLGLEVLAGHGLDYDNIGPVRGLPHLAEVNIGHSIVSRAVFVGLEQAVREMKELLS